MLVETTWLPTMHPIDRLLRLAGGGKDRPVVAFQHPQ